VIAAHFVRRLRPRLLQIYCHTRNTLRLEWLSSLTKIVDSKNSWKFTDSCLPRDASIKRGLSRHAVSVCPSVTFVHFVKTNKRIFSFFSPPSSQAILGFPYQTAWQYSDGTPPPVECRWGRQKSRFWGNILLHCVLWTVPAAIHLAATDHGEFITLVAGKRRSLLMAGNNDEVYNKKPQR